MIIPDQNAREDDASKTPLLGTSNRPVSADLSGTSEAELEHPPPPPYEPSSQAPKSRRWVGSIVAKRFFPALGYATLIYVILWLPFLWGVNYRHRHPIYPPYVPPSALQCISPKYQTSWTFSNSSSLYFTAPNSHPLSGTFYVVGIPGRTTVTVQIEMKAEGASGDGYYVCLVEGDEGIGSTGVTIYAPEEEGEDSAAPVVFTITLLVPLLFDTDALRTTLPRFHQVIGRQNSKAKMNFATLSLEGVVSPIDILGDVTVRNFKANTTLSNIKGTFEVLDSLLLQTSSAPIEAIITLLGLPGSSKPTSLDIITENAPIDVGIYLKNRASPFRSLETRGPPPPSRASPIFTVSLRSDNAPVVARLLSYFATPPTLYFSAKTIYAPVVAQVHALYEGTFEVSSPEGQAEVTADGVARGRIIYEEQESCLVNGYLIRPGGDRIDLMKGRVDLSTSYARAVLLFSDNDPPGLYHGKKEDREERWKERKQGKGWIEIIPWSWFTAG